MIQDDLIDGKILEGIVVDGGYAKTVDLVFQHDGLFVIVYVFAFSNAVDSVKYGASVFDVRIFDVVDHLGFEGVVVAKGDRIECVAEKRKDEGEQDAQNGDDAIFLAQQFSVFDNQNGLDLAVSEKVRLLNFEKLREAFEGIVVGQTDAVFSFSNGASAYEELFCKIRL